MNLQDNAGWFVPTMGEFVTSGKFPNVFYLTLIRDAVKQAQNKPENAASIIHFVHSLFDVCRVDETSAEILIK